MDIEHPCSHWQWEQAQQTHVNVCQMPDEPAPRLTVSAGSEGFAGLLTFRINTTSHIALIDFYEQTFRLHFPSLSHTDHELAC